MKKMNQTSLQNFQGGRFSDWCAGAGIGGGIGSLAIAFFATPVAGQIAAGIYLGFTAACTYDYFRKS